MIELIDKYSIFVEEWLDDDDDNKIYATVIVNDKSIAKSFANADINLLLEEIKQFILNNDQKI